MRVLLTADSVGGVWTYALELADALADRRIEVVLATMGPPLSGGQRDELRRSRIARAYAEDVKLEWMDDPWADLDRAGRWLLRIRDEVQPDVIHLNGYSHATLPWEAPVLRSGGSGTPTPTPPGSRQQPWSSPPRAPWCASSSSATASRANVQ